MPHIPITFYNTLTRKKEVFTPIRENEVGYYSCGPTVYNFAHIGNLRSYVLADTVKRVLAYNGYAVKHVMNITDVGHLTSDADTGEDKMLAGAKREKKTVWEVAEFFTAAFRKNLEDLNIIPPTIWCKATDHIAQQIALIQKLEENGFAYATGGNVYFDTSKLADYGKLAGLDASAPREARVESDSNKRNPHDFVLWFTKSKFQEQEMKWESPWGVGYPGWHIECSAMSTHYLGQPFDIHSGGIDHIPVHHTNEIAQSEAAFGVPMARYWIHGAFLIIDEGKMSKSEGNFITLQTLTDRGFDPLSYRHFCFSAHYRQQLNFTWEALSASQTGYLRLKDAIHRIRAKASGASDSGSPRKDVDEVLARAQREFDTAANDDLNMPKALAVLHEMLSNMNKLEGLSESDYATIESRILDFDRVLGLGFDAIQALVGPPQEVAELVSLRNEARRQKNWSEADRLRAEIESRGYRVEDAGDETIVTEKSQ